MGCTACLCVALPVCGWHPLFVSLRPHPLFADCTLMRVEPLVCMLARLVCGLHSLVCGLHSLFYGLHVPFVPLFACCKQGVCNPPHKRQTQVLIVRWDAPTEETCSDTESRRSQDVTSVRPSGTSEVGLG